jgi:UDP-N-acetylmuramyl pentapeptide phosphotransferase/UDP-N-acetylglucosamine-1-phosphate transferase
MTILLVLLISFGLGLLGAFLVSKFGFRLGLVDIPGARSSHDKPIPKGGGIGIPVAMAVSSFWLIHSHQILVGLALAMAAMAFINDRFEAPVGLRLVLGLCLSAALVIFLKKNSMAALFGGQGMVMRLAEGLLFTIYIAAATNIFNFMDGINGLAGLEAVVSLALLGLAALFLKNSSEIFLLCLSGTAAAAGFLLLNFPRAKVFMGDVGSIFIGFLFAGLTVLLTSNAKDFLLFALFQGVFYIDGVSTLLVRLLHRENILLAHKKHLYQKLVHHSGWTHIKVTLVYGVLQIIIGLGGFALFQAGTLFLAAFWAILFVAYWSILIRKKYHLI